MDRMDALMRANPGWRFDLEGAHRDGRPVLVLKVTNPAGEVVSEKGCRMQDVDRGGVVARQKLAFWAEVKVAGLAPALDFEPTELIVAGERMTFIEP
jgi:hypothetical protein